MKNTLFVLLVVLLSACTQKDNVSKPLLAYVPGDAALIIAINDQEGFKNTLKNNDFLSDLKKSKMLTAVLDKIQFLEYIHPDSKGILVLTKSDPDNFDFLYITENTWNLINLGDSQNNAPKGKETTDSTFKDYSKDGISFFGLQKNQKAFISSSKLLLEKVDKNNAIEQSAILKKLYTKANKNKPASLFIDMNRRDLILSAIDNKHSQNQISNVSDWISLDINNNSEHLNLSGIGISKDSTSNAMTFFANTKPTTNNTALYTPAKADAILSYTFDNYATFAKNRELSTGVVSPVEPPMNTVEEIGVICIEDQKVIVLNTFGSESISEYLLTQKKEAIDYQGQEILQLHKSDFINNRFSPIVNNFDAKFCVLIDNAFIFSSTSKLLKIVIRDYKNKTTFNKTSLFKTLNKDIAQESSILLISNSKNIKADFKSNFSEGFMKEINQIDLSGYGFATQRITDNNFYHTNVVVNKIGSTQGKNSKNTAQSFKIKLDAEIATNPQFVINHQTGKKEIIVQDQNNVLYLISEKGKVLWKKKLNSLVQGKIKQVDIFKNGRLQLAFTTNNQFLILDRNGDEVKKFTQTYEGGNLNPLAVFDYVKNKNYRFVVTQGVKIFMYDNQAKIVKGFKYTTSKSPIIAAPRHLVIGNKDVLVFQLKDGSLKLLNRVGDVRIKVNKTFNFSKNEVFKYKNKFTLTDQKGVMHQIDLNGKITQTNFNLSSDHGMATTENSLVLMNDNILIIKGKKVELELGVYTDPEIFILNNKIYVSVTDLQNEKVYLFDSQARSIPNFPVQGASTIDLTNVNKGKAIKLVTKEDNSTVSIYNVN